MSRGTGVVALLVGALFGGALLPATAAASGSSAREWPGDPSARGEARVTDLRPRASALVPRIEDMTVEDQGKTTVVLGSDILFAFGSADLPPDAAESLAGVVGTVRSGGARSVRIEGHTDGVGQPGDNQVLSERRAAAVEAALRAALGPDAPPMTSTGFGEARPLTAESTSGKDDPVARAGNRRVEVVVQR